MSTKFFAYSKAFFSTAKVPERSASSIAKNAVLHHAKLSGTLELILFLLQGNFPISAPAAVLHLEGMGCRDGCFITSALLPVVCKLPPMSGGRGVGDK